MKTQIMIKQMFFAVILLTAALPAFAAEEYGAVFSKVNGQVEVIRPGKAAEPAQVGMHLSEKDQIRTAEGGTAEILLDEKGGAGSLEVAEKTHIRLGTLQKNPATEERVTLLQTAIGKVNVHVQKLKGSSKFEVETPTATTGVRGTSFTVEVSPVESKK